MTKTKTKYLYKLLKFKKCLQTKTQFNWVRESEQSEEWTLSPEINEQCNTLIKRSALNIY